MPKNNAAAYIRVSTDDQTEYSPDAQLRAIREFCKRNNFALLDEHIYIDEGISGRSAAKRPEFQRMISTAKSKEKPFGSIIVHKFDRFARSREDSVVYKSLLRKECGVRVISVTENIEDDKFSVILEAMLEAMAEYYSINLSEEVKKGMTEKALRGEPLTIAPFGYKIEEKKLVVYPEQAEIIKSIYDRFLNDIPIFTIAQDLNAAGILTNRGNKFENRTIEYILRNPVYMGSIRWNPLRRTRRNYDDPDLMIVPGHHEPLIDTEIWNQTQEKIMRNKDKYSKYSKVNTSSSHWLVGILKCSVCGGGLVKNGSVYLQCNHYARGACAVSHLIRISDAEQAIMSQLKHDAVNSSHLAAVSKGGKATNFSLIEKQLSSLKKRLERAKEAYAAGIDTIDEYRISKEKITADIKHLEEQQAIESPTSPIIDYAKLQERIAEAEKRLSDPNLSIDDKKIVANTIFDQIIWDKGEKQLYITYNIE